MFKVSANSIGLNLVDANYKIFINNIINPKTIVVLGKNVKKPLVKQGFLFFRVLFDQ
jgi:hypothetical protein